VESLQLDAHPPRELMKLFTLSIDTALKASQFSPTCTGKTVRVVFAFRLGNEPSETVWFEAPNRFAITAGMPSIDTESPR